jgi:hypothetical protein
MIHNFKHSLAVMIILCFITAIAFPQTADSLKVATIQEKSETISLRMERELSLTKAQSTQVMNILTERFQSLERSGSDDVSLKTVNRKATEKLASILNDEQYALYQELRSKKKRDKDQYMKDHAGFAFSREDREMDF